MSDNPYMVRGAFGREPLKEPCVECPLRRGSKPGALGGYTAGKYLQVLHGPADLACHMSRGFKTQDHAQQRSCAGVAMYRLCNDVHLFGHAMEAALAVEPRDDLVLATPREFVEHHATATGEVGTADDVFRASMGLLADDLRCMARTSEPLALRLTFLGMAEECLDMAALGLGQDGKVRQVQTATNYPSTGGEEPVRRRPAGASEA